MVLVRFGMVGRGFEVVGGRGEESEWVGLNLNDPFTASPFTTSADVFHFFSFPLLGFFDTSLCLGEIVNVGSILRSSGGLLVGQQVCQTDHRDRNASPCGLNFSFAARWIFHAADFTHEVNAQRRVAEFDGLVQFDNGTFFRRRSNELGQGTNDPVRIFRGCGNPKVDITGVSDVAVVDDGPPADDHVLDTLGVQ
jgi:hypothetical protein